jgi:hypothetical protein
VCWAKAVVESGNRKRIVEDALCRDLFFEDDNTSIRQGKSLRKVQFGSLSIPNVFPQLQVLPLCIVTDVISL